MTFIEFANEHFIGFFLLVVAFLIAIVYTVNNYIEHQIPRK